MHILAEQIRSLDDAVQAVDLGQSPADVVFLSFSDSDLSLMAAVHAGLGAAAPTLRLANLAALRHPYSVDLYLENTARHARFVLVRLLGGADYWRYGVDELAMAEIVVLARHLTDKNKQMHEGIWDKSAGGAHEVRGRTLGLVGYGNIGSQLSVLAESFGMRVWFYDVVDKLAMGNAKRVDSLDELLATCETISVHVDGRPENTNLFGEAEFGRMRPRALFLNLSRGHVVDIPALAAAVRSGHIAGAGLDVYPSEPRAAGDRFVNELQGLPNVILTPHVGGSTQEAQVDIGRFTAGKLVDFMAGGSTVMSVNLPQVQVPAQQGRRVIHIHRNVPGVLANLTKVLSSHQANIAFQALNTNSEVGYVVTDVTSAAPGLTRELTEIPHTIRVRVS